MRLDVVSVHIQLLLLPLGLQLQFDLQHVEFDRVARLHEVAEQDGHEQVQHDEVAHHDQRDELHHRDFVPADRVISDDVPLFP